MIFRKGLKTLDNFLLSFRRRDNVEYMFTPGATDFDTLFRNSRVIEIELGQTGGTRDDHKDLFWNEISANPEVCPEFLPKDFLPINRVPQTTFRVFRNFTIFDIMMKGMEKSKEKKRVPQCQKRRESRNLDTRKNLFDLRPDILIS